MEFKKKKRKLHFLVQNRLFLDRGRYNNEKWSVKLKKKITSQYLVLSLLLYYN